jgi:hypothetical protein
MKKPKHNQVTDSHHEKARMNNTHPGRNLVRWACLLVVALLMAGCESLFTDFGPQPIYLNQEEYEPMLNILGVLRPDVRDGTPMSFIHVESSFPVTEFADSVEITDADVRIYRLENGVGIDTVAFVYTEGTGFLEKPEYRNAEFIPVAGETYGLTIRREGYPELTSTTTIPQSPEIVAQSMNVNEGILSWSMWRDEGTLLYDIFILAGQDFYLERIRRPESGDIEVRIELENGPEPDQILLLIYGYDDRLSEYMTYNVSIKPNTYHTQYSTVENGYGCFGSLNLFEEIVTL